MPDRKRLEGHLPRPLRLWKQTHIITLCKSCFKRPPHSDMSWASNKSEGEFEKTNERKRLQSRKFCYFDRKYVFSSVITQEFGSPSSNFFGVLMYPHTSPQTARPCKGCDWPLNSVKAIKCLIYDRFSNSEMNFWTSDPNEFPNFATKFGIFWNRL